MLAGPTGTTILQAFQPANTALACVLIKVGICRIICMPLWAVSLGLVSCPSRMPNISTLTIDLVSNRLKMFWITTRRISAKMVKLRPVRNRTNDQFIRNAVCRKAASWYSFPIDPKLTVAIRVTRRQPNPTWTKIGAIIRDWPVFINFSPEESEGVIIKEHRKGPPFGVMHRTVNAVPVPSMISEGRGA